MLADLGRYTASHPNSLIEGVHLFPLGGIAAAADFARRLDVVQNGADQSRALRKR